jgi:hypothetical protein
MMTSSGVREEPTSATANLTLLFVFDMAKAPAIKFPRIQAGFYNVTLDGQLMGYIAKKVEGKDTTWVVYNTQEPELTMETLPISTIADETELFREAKEFSKKFFTELPQEENEPEVEVETVVLQEPEWAEEAQDQPQDFFDEMNEYEEVEEELVAV